MGVKSMKRSWVLGAAAALALTGLAAAGPARAVDGVTADKIVVGGMGPLTGPLAHLVLPALHGIEAVFNEVNAAGGVHGRKLEYVLEDDECQPSKGVGAIKKLIHEVKPFMIIGGGCSNASLAQKPEIIEAKIPWQIVASTADSLTEPAHPYIFTTMSAAWMEVYGALQVALDAKSERIAVLWQPDAWGKARIEPMRKALADKGIQAVAIEEVPVEPADLTPTVLKLQQAKADAVILLLFPKAGIPFLRDSYKFGYQPLMVGGSPLAELDVMAKGLGTEEAVKPLRAVSPSGFGVDDAEIADWKAVIAKYFPNDRFTTVHLFGIAAGQAAVEALRRAGPEPTREKLIEAYSTLEMKPDTYAGPIKCVPGDHQCHRTLGVFALKDGKVTGVGHSTPVR